MARASATWRRSPLGEEGERLPLIGGIDVTWAHWLPGKPAPWARPPQPLEVNNHPGVSLNKLAPGTVLASGLEPSLAGAEGRHVHGLVWVQGLVEQGRVVQRTREQPS